MNAKDFLKVISDNKHLLNKRYLPEIRFTDVNCYCPITLVCKIVKNIDYPCLGAYSAAQEIGIDNELIYQGIIGAADDKIIGKLETHIAWRVALEEAVGLR